MAIPGYAPREPGGGTPSIYNEHSNPFERYHNESSRPRPFTSDFTPGSMAMGITNRRPQTEDQIAPPPLPPPKYVGPMHERPESSMRPHHDHKPFASSAEPSSFDSFGHSPRNERRVPHKSYSRTGLDRDEGYHSLASTAIS